ncbi:MAG: hypothetical protein ACREIP_01595 [Alphaproteobacteria bacterium]
MFRYCAAYYLWQWLTMDRAFVKIFQQEVTEKALLDLLSKYEVIRTVPGKGAGRLKEFTKALNSKSAQAIQADEAANLVHDLFCCLRGRYGRQFLSAITKAAWMRWRHPIAIYDKRARRALVKQRKILMENEFKDPENNYNAYHKLWMAFYDRCDTQNGLNDASGWLSNSHYAQSVVERGGATQEEIAQWVNEDWFRNRIIDMLLFHLGDSDGRVGLHPAEAARFLGPNEQL